MFFVGLAAGFTVALMVATACLVFLVRSQDKAYEGQEERWKRSLALKDEHIAFLQSHVPWAPHREVGATPPDETERILH